MPSNELKQRRKTTQGKPHEQTTEIKPKAEPGKGADEPDRNSQTSAASPPSAVDIRTITCLLSLAVCLVLTWVVLLQAARFADIEEKSRLLYEKAADIEGLSNEISEISRKFESAQHLLTKLKGQAKPPDMEKLKQDIAQLTEWSASLTAKREASEENLSALSRAVAQIEQKTASITKDVAVKVSAVKTDLRRMSGLESEVEALLSSAQQLGEKVKQAEKQMVQKIGDLLVGSIARTSELKSSSERNSDKVDLLKRKLAELKEEDARLSERLLNLESGRARLLKTVTFASDLKPKVFTMRKDFSLLEPRVSDLTLRIGRLASDILEKEREIALLKDTFSNLTVVKSDLQRVKQQLTEVREVSDMFAQGNQPGE
ncbi:inhibitor of nuclear factor kappa-B kinase-interacting protein isoform X2 [Lepisosteus oculatus]|uniref:inhibitor of nuclear factor kappa-B kinase-interacting protein isoform X2 n=1 Tax=Lepisosteus oculatus TaxID=7918 RepID=UPI003716EA58